MNGQMGCQPGDGIVGLFAPTAIVSTANGMQDPIQLLAFGSIGVELVGLSYKGCCTSLVTRLTQDGRAEG